MVISSRTPEGDHNVCPVCKQFIKVEPSQPPGDAPCPMCGTLLWFQQGSVKLASSSMINNDYATHHPPDKQPSNWSPFTVLLRLRVNLAAMTRFDLGKLNVIGWILLLVALGLFFSLALMTKDSENLFLQLFNEFLIAPMVGMMFFFGVKGLLHKMRVVIFR